MLIYIITYDPPHGTYYRLVQPLLKGTVYNEKIPLKGENFIIMFTARYLIFCLTTIHKCSINAFQLVTAVKNVRYIISKYKGAEART